MPKGTTREEHLHIAGQVEICVLEPFRNTPKEVTAITRALKPLTQVKDVSIVHGRDGKYYLFVELDLGNPSPSALRTLAPYVIYRITQKAHQALEYEQLTLVK